MNKASLTMVTFPSCTCTCTYRLYMYKNTLKYMYVSLPEHGRCLHGCCLDKPPDNGGTKSMPRKPEMKKVHVCQYCMNIIIIFTHVHVHTCIYMYMYMYIPLIHSMFFCVLVPRVVERSKRQLLKGVWHLSLPSNCKQQQVLQPFLTTQFNTKSLQHCMLNVWI